MDSTPDNRVLIIGAGAAGLLIAQVLKRVCTPEPAIIHSSAPSDNGIVLMNAILQENIPCTVFEQDPSPTARPRDWNYGVYWAQSGLSECLPPELLDQLEACQVDHHTPAASDILPGFNGKTGERLVDVPAPYSLRLKRRKFLQLISTGLDIQRAKRLQNVDSNGSSATAFFEDGTHATGKLLIGAEGAHSRVREYLFGPETAALKPSCVVSSIATPRLPVDVSRAVRQLHPRYCAIFHPDGYFSWVGIHNETEDPADWEFLLLMSWISEQNTGLSGEAILDDLKQKASRFAEPFRSVFESLPTGSKIWHSRLSYWETQPWDNRNGTLTLVGDAAHPMTFHRGQGLNNAILDAASLSREIAKLDEKSLATLRPALEAYEKDVCQRGREAVESSNLNSVSIHNWEQLQDSPLFKMGLKKDSA